MGGMAVDTRLSLVSEFTGIYSRIVLPAVIVIITASMLLFEREVENIKDRLQQTLQSQVYQARKIINCQLDYVMQDLLFLKSTDSLRQVANDPGPYENKTILARTFKALIEHKNQYDYVSYVDFSGKEKVRVNNSNGNGAIANETSLRQIEHRYSLNRELSNGHESQDISPLEHNEMPIKPIIRLTTPVYDELDNILGTVVIGYPVKRLLDKISENDSTAIGHLLLLNSESYWLRGDDLFDESESKHAGKIEYTMKKIYAAVRSRMANSESGQFINEHGLFSYVTIGSQGLFVNNQHNEQWKLVNLLDYTEMEAQAKMVKNRYLCINTILITMCSLVALWLARARLKRIKEHRKKHEKEIILSDIIDSAFDAIITINERGAIETFNPAASRMFGYHEEDVIGQKINILMDSPEREYHDLHIHNYIETQAGKLVGKPGRVIGLRKDEKRIEIEISIGAKKRNEQWLFTAICRQNSS
jgi:PAS domain S-box-containing protein